MCCKSGILCLLKINPFSSFLELFWVCGNIFYILCLSFTINRFISYESYTWKSLGNFSPTTTINQLIFSLTQYVLVCGMWVAAKYYKRRNNSFIFFISCFKTPVPYNCWIIYWIFQIPEKKSIEEFSFWNNENSLKISRKIIRITKIQ